MAFVSHREDKLQLVEFLYFKKYLESIIILKSKFLKYNFRQHFWGSVDDSQMLGNLNSLWVTCNLIEILNIIDSASYQLSSSGPMCLAFLY